MTVMQLATKNLKTLVFAFCLVFVGGGMLTACSEQGPAEEAGEKMDRAVKDAGEAADDARDAIDEAADDTRDALDDARD